MSSDQPPQPVVRQHNSNSRLPFWILTSVSVGFLLPVCGCAMLFFTSIASLSLAGLGSSGTAVGSSDAVAIVRVQGTILSSDSSTINTTDATSARVIADLRQAVEDPTVKAIVLRVDSPGGSVTGSAQIYEEILKIEKPIVTSMAGLAASGGYYISAPTDYIMARPDTVTGSIGVIMTLFNAEKLLDDLGVEVTILATGPNKALGSLYDDLAPEQRAILDAFIDESYQEFVRVVAEGRGMSREDVLTLADGRIYTGRQALALNLVDELGNFDAAVEKAAELGDIRSDPRIVEYDRVPSFRELLLGFNNGLNRGTAEQIVETLDQFSLPSVEYRYAGPGTQ